SVTTIGDAAFYECTDLHSVILPSSLVSIAESAFRGCRSLTSVSIPKGVTSIGNYVFMECTSLVGITVDLQNASFSSVDGALFNKRQTALVAYPGGKPGAYTIPDSVTDIAPLAFAFCPGLTSVTIPDTVTSIENGVFSSCSNLTTITI